MFAIFLHESMTTFYQIIASFPTIIFSVMLIVCMAYWVIAVLGLVELEMLDIDLDGDIDAHDSTAAQQGVAGVLMRFGLNGVPVTIVITSITAIGWIISYYSIYHFAAMIPDTLIFTIPFKLAVLGGAILLAIYSTAFLIRPLRKLFKKLNIDETKHIVGQIVLVKSAVVNDKTGVGFMDDGGAGLQLNIRTTNTSEEFRKGDLVVIIEQLDDQNLFRVVSKSAFDNTEI